SDLLIHHMNNNLADNITQKLAEKDMFHTTPLWGIGQRRFFLHNNQTDDLLVAIKAHASEDQDQQDEKRGNNYPASEANAVIRKFNVLSTTDKQAILDFLRSL